jgi:transcriptional repressor NF-X1
MDMKSNVLPPFNSFRITNPRFGLTIDEVRVEVDNVLAPSSPFTFDIEFLPSEDVVLKAVSRTLQPRDLERMLQSLRMPLSTAIASRAYGSLQLCTTDNSLNVTRFESDGGNGDGWSKVAARKAATKTMLQSSDGGAARNAFAALSGGKVTFARKRADKVKAPAEPVVDDWEVAEMAEEEREKTAGGTESDGLLGQTSDDETQMQRESIPVQAEGSQ